MAGAATTTGNTGARFLTERREAGTGKCQAWW